MKRNKYDLSVERQEPDIIWVINCCPDGVVV